MAKTKLKIVEFSQMMQVIVKTLCHYEQKGLLFPCEVDWGSLLQRRADAASQYNSPIAEYWLLPIWNNNVTRFYALFARVTSMVHGIGETLNSGLVVYNSDSY